MKKTIVRNALTVAAVALATQAMAQVTFYQGENFQGDSFTTRQQVGDLGRFGFNDSASSVKVGGNNSERWEVCEDVRFNGRCVVLRPGEYPSLRAMGLNNRISSAHVFARVDPPPPPVAAPVASRLVFYEKENFGGRSLIADSDLGTLGPTGFNNRVSSVEVFGGPWEICQQDAYAGPCTVLRPGQYPSLRQMGFDNRISSVRALRDTATAPGDAKVVFYEREGFAGRSFTARSEIGDFGRTGFNDRASSVDVLGGWFEVCSGPGFSGPCAFLRPGRYPSLASMGLNNRISSVRPAANADQATALPPSLPPAPVYDARRRGDEPLFEANVVSVRAIVGPPEQRCWVERDQVATDPGRPNVGAGIAGALIGGILGHQVGKGTGRDLATVGGAIAGGALGSQVGRDTQTQGQDVQRCTSVPSNARADLYDVTYNFRGQEHRVQMTSPPGPTILVNRNGEPRA
ncbi:MAG: beta/gamma crystallin-related protein [Burkholderiaceae bacterium]